MTTKESSAKPKRERKKSPKDIANDVKILQRQTWATDLKVQGLSYRRIATRMKELGVVPKTYSNVQAMRDVNAFMAGIVSEQKELVLDNFYIDIRRYDELFEKAWALALPHSEEGEMPLPPDPVYFGVVTHILGVRERLFNYKSIFGDKEKEQQPNFNVNVDWDTFTVDELLTIRRRIQAGEDTIIVITQITEARKLTTENSA